MKTFTAKKPDVPKTLTITETHGLLEELYIHAGTHKQFARGIRNYTIAMLMLEAGLRVGETIKLTWSDLFWNSEPVKTIIIRAEIAKTDTERQIPVSTRLANALKEYHQHHNIKNDGIADRPAFGNPCRTRTLTTRQVERFIEAASQKAFGRRINPHMLRHTFASKLMRITNIRIVQELLGHKSLTSTQVYTHPNGEDLKTAIDAL